MLEPHTAAGLALATATVVVGLVCLSLVSRRKEGVRSEKELIATLGVPMVAARPLAAADLARQLSTQWFSCGRPVLAVVSAEGADGGTQVAAELARRRGEPGAHAAGESARGSRVHLRDHADANLTGSGRWPDRPRVLNRQQVLLDI